jgi:ABC-type antimicrobial peptide transport system permease subunit
VHSLLAYRVARQRKEIGLRVALGAARQTVVRMVLARLFRAVLIGLAGGIIGSVVMSLVCRSLFAGAAALDAGALATSVLVLLGAAILASLGPSYRAACVDPATVLRES